MEKSGQQKNTNFQDFKNPAGFPTHSLTAAPAGFPFSTIHPASSINSNKSPERFYALRAFCIL
jgi:hypothetical protein